MSTIPNEEECLLLLKREGVSDRVIAHTCTVMVVAMAIANRCGADLDLVRAGGLLHDLGRSRTHGIRHAVEGATLARKNDLSPLVVLIIQKHMGAGFTTREAEAMGLPPGDYMPATLEEKIVCHADNLVGDRDLLTIDQAYANMVRKGYPTTAERMRAMHAELSARCGQDVDLIVRSLHSPRHEGPCARFLASKGN